ncbi:MAG: hypothetical protein GY715_07145 [Planctomycetes bacterium]|nr:hypothetical protein [Planctomycetota bacterium]
MTATPTPDIVLRVPGRWDDPAALAGALPSGFALAADHLAMPDGSLIGFVPMPPDTEFPFVFGAACFGHERPVDEHAVDGYTVNACLAGPGGSVTSATRMVVAATALLNAGGLGVFIDNSLVAHEAMTWMEIVAPIGIEALLCIFLNMFRGDESVYSIGLHTLGMREVVVRRSGDDDRDRTVLLDFIEAVAFGDRASAGDVYHCGDVSMRVTCGVSARFERHLPVYNPYGEWRLELIGCR